MILTERQAEAELTRRGPEARRRVIAAFEEYRELAEWLARIHEVEADAEEVSVGVLRARLMRRFWRFFEQRHEAHIEWVRSLEASEQGGSR